MSTDSTPKWKGPPYRLAVDAPPAKPNPAGITIPVIKYTANPEALERRVLMLVRFDSSTVKKDTAIVNQMVMPPVDLAGAEGKVPEDYLSSADQSLAHLLAAYGVKGKVQISVLLARSSLSSHPSDGEIDSKRLSDWLPIDLDFKGGHGAH